MSKRASRCIRFMVSCIVVLHLFFLISSTTAQTNYGYSRNESGTVTAGPPLNGLASLPGQNSDILVSDTPLDNLKAAGSWTRTWDSAHKGDDKAHAMTVDKLGNVYVTGRSVGNDSYDYVTIKYDTEGKFQWSHRYNGTANGSDTSKAIAVDDSGNVYVTGESYGVRGLTDFDIATIKYDATGNAQWVQQYNGPANGYETPHAIALDASGGVYVAGQSETPSHDFDFVLVKYDSAGTERWVRRYSSSGKGFDSACCVVVDSTGSVLVAGTGARTIPTSEARDIEKVVAKYSENGDLKWLKRYSPPGQVGEYQSAATGMALDSRDNVYLAGWGYCNVQDLSHEIVKYGTSGKLEWTAYYHSPDTYQNITESIAIDADDNVYIVGSNGFDGGAPKYATLKYTSNGEFQWINEYDGGQIKGISNAKYIMCDLSGNIFVTGQSKGSDYFVDHRDLDIVTIKYSSDGKRQWIKRYDGGTRGLDTPVGIASDINGNIYVAGSSETNSGTSDYVIIKYNPGSDTNIID